MFAFVISSVLAAAPLTLPSPPPELSAPLGHFGDVVEPVPSGGVNAVEKPVMPVVAGCDTKQVAYLLRMVSGTGRVVEQLQQWLDRAPGVEAKLFARKAVLTEVVKQLAQSQLEPKRACKPLPMEAGYQLSLASAPRAFCPLPPTANTGDFWFFTKGKPAAVVSIAGGDVDACKLRISSVLFDAKGQARVRAHANWGGAASAQLVGDGCKVVDFTFVSDTQTFAPSVKACKR